MGGRKGKGGGVIDKELRRHKRGKELGVGKRKRKGKDVSLGKGKRKKKALFAICALGQREGGGRGKKGGGRGGGGAD